jgi:uncharacterized protein GlcG (DUF336 family)
MALSDMRKDYGLAGLVEKDLAKNPFRQFEQWFAEAEAAKNNWAVVISIIDSGGNIVMLHRRDDGQLSSIEIAQGKAKTALMFKRPSKVLDDAIAGGGAGLRFLALKDIVPLEGGVPVVLDGKIIGAIGVSGVLSSQDAQIARAGIDGLK